jgi:hypothetical protein
MIFIIPSFSTKLWFCQLWYVLYFWTLELSVLLEFKYESEHIVLLFLLYQSSCCVCTAVQYFIACGVLEGFLHLLLT